MKKKPFHNIKREIRKGVEIAVSVITAKFGKVIKTTTIECFLIKLKLFILTYSIDRFFKLHSSLQNLAFN